MPRSGALGRPLPSPDRSTTHSTPASPPRPPPPTRGHCRRDRRTRTWTFASPFARPPGVACPHRDERPPRVSTTRAWALSTYWAGLNYRPVANEVQDRPVQPRVLRRLLTCRSESRHVRGQTERCPRGYLPSGGATPRRKR